MGICSLLVTDAPVLKPLQVRQLPKFVIICTLQQAGSMSEVVRARDREEFPYYFLCAVYIQVDLAENASVLKHRGCGGVCGGRKHLWKGVGNNVLSQDIIWSSAGLGDCKHSQGQIWFNYSLPGTRQPWGLRYFSYAYFPSAKLSWLQSSKSWLTLV